MKNKNLEECPLWIQIKTISHWANQKNRNPLSFFQFLKQRVFFWIFNKKVRAVLTVEAAFVVPMFLLALCTMVGLLDCYRIQSIVKTSIYQSAMELGMYAYHTHEANEGISVINSAMCMAYAQARLPEFDEHVSVSMAGSYYKDNTITLIASVKYDFPIQFFPLPALTMVNISEVSSWVGESNQETHEESSVTYPMVYVTENKSVYHTNAACSHIDIKIYKTKKKNVKAEYEPCQKCCKGQSMDSNDVIYYTKTGECYHIEKGCGSLKRIVHMVEFSQVKGLPICERCEKRGKL